MSQPQLVTVYRSQGILGAEVVKAKLEAAGIPALLKYESAGLVLGLTVDGLGQVEVQVPAAQEAAASALIAEEPEPADPEEADQVEDKREK
ncbi:MAG: putative signal transducing protein [Anaerolineae bacterium]